MSDPASQFRIQDSKEKLQTAYNYAVKAKESAESNFKQDQDSGLADGRDFKTWAVQNEPAYSAAINNYQAAKSAYDAALQNGDIEAFRAWDKKYREVMMEDPVRPNYEALVEP